MSYPDFTVPLTEIKKPLLELQQEVSGGDTIFFDYQFSDLAAAIAAIGSTAGDLVITSPNWSDGNANNTVPTTLRLDFRGAGSLSLSSGKTTTINSSGKKWPDRQIFTGAGLAAPIGPQFFATWWGDKTITVSPPTTAPTLTATDITGPANFNATASTTYKIAYTYRTWNGETGLSPSTSVTASTTGQGFAVLPIASLANNSKYAVGAYFYISDDGGTTWHRADGPFVSPAIVSFGDDMVWGGYPIKWNASGAAPPTAGTTATTKSGLTVSVPSTAPTVTALATFGAVTKYGAYSYICGDGTETAISSISSGCTTASGKYIAFQIPKEPPTGAVKLNLYLGDSATSGAMKLQDTVPLNHVTPLIHSYNSSGAAPSAGASQSVVSGFQQAVDAALESLGGGVMVTSLVSTQIPILLKLKNSSGTQVFGIHIFGVSHNAQDSPAPPIRISYTGTQTDVVGICVTGSAYTWSDLDFYDPNNRVKYGMAFGDFTGGGCFNSDWARSTIYANAAGGRGLYSPAQGLAGVTNAHITSEQYFTRMSFHGKAWGIDLHGNQSGDIVFRDCGFASAGDSNSANSGMFRNAGANFNIQVDGGNAASSGEYSFFGCGDIQHQIGSGARFQIKNFHTEATSGPFFFVHISQSSGGPNSGEMGLRSCSFSSANADNYAVYSATDIALTLEDNERGGGSIWFNYVNSAANTGSTSRIAIVLVGRNTFFTPANFKANGNAVSIQYNTPMVEAWLSAFALTNESAQQSLIETNAAGDLVLVPYSNKVSIPDDPYDATAWNGNTGIPTKNAVRDKIESLGSGGADQALDNLASVAINTSLLPGTDNAIDLGSSSKYWRDAFIKRNLQIRDTSAAFDALLAFTSSTAFTANRTLTIDLVNAARTLKLSGNPTLADWFDQSVKTTASPTFNALTLSTALAVAQGGTGATTAAGARTNLGLVIGANVASPFAIGNVTLVNGDNDDIVIPSGDRVAITATGPTAGFNISGFTNPDSLDGKELWVYLNIVQAATLLHNARSVAGVAGGAFGQRITMSGGANKTFASSGLVRLQFLYLRAVGAGVGYWVLFGASDGTTAGF